MDEKTTVQKQICLIYVAFQINMYGLLCYWIIIIKALLNYLLGLLSLILCY